MSQRITVDPVTRIEGHAKITIHLDDDGKVAESFFHVEQFRGFEKLSEGRPFHEMPALTARVCGICPVSHLIASAKTCDALLAVTPPRTARNLRRIMNLSQIIQSHALSFFHLSSPDLLLGWDTDQFPTDLYSTVYAMLEVLAAGGIGAGGMNFDAKVRRGSFEPVDLFHAHIGGMDAFARGLVIASAIIEDGFLEDFKKQRYSSWESEGSAALAGSSSLEDCERFIREKGEPEVESGRQEYLENLINSFI